MSSTMRWLWLILTCGMLQNVARAGDEFIPESCEFMLQKSYRFDFAARADDLVKYLALNRNYFLRASLVEGMNIVKITERFLGADPRRPTFVNNAKKLLDLAEVAYDPVLSMSLNEHKREMLAQKVLAVVAAASGVTDRKAFAELFNRESGYYVRHPALRLFLLRKALMRYPHVNKEERRFDPWVEAFAENFYGEHKGFTDQEYLYVKGLLFPTVPGAPTFELDWITAEHLNMPQLQELIEIAAKRTEWDLVSELLDAVARRGDDAARDLYLSLMPTPDLSLRGEIFSRFTNRFRDDEQTMHEYLDAVWYRDDLEERALFLSAFSYYPDQLSAKFLVPFNQMFLEQTALDPSARPYRLLAAWIGTHPKTARKQWESIFTPEQNRALLANLRRTVQHDEEAALHMLEMGSVLRDPELSKSALLVAEKTSNLNLIFDMVFTWRPHRDELFRLDKRVLNLASRVLREGTDAQRAQIFWFMGEAWTLEFLSAAQAAELHRYYVEFLSHPQVEALDVGKMANWWTD